MTWLTAGDGAAPGSPAAPHSASRGKPARTTVLADPRIQLGTAATVILITAMAARRKHVGPCESRAFRAVNELPDSLYPPAWLAMQLGAFGTAPAAAGTACLAGERELAGRLLVSGTATWALAKLVKQVVRRPRPAALLPGTRCRGRQPAGLGYLSGHAGVAAALAAAALPRPGRAGRTLVLIAVPVVGLTRIYAGAHLPLDVAGGAALGLAVDAAVAVAGRPERPMSASAQAHGPAKRGRAALPAVQDASEA
jgi:glycosyltransferase 2 family protein